MCGILGVVSNEPVNQLLYDGLMVLQHHGQDAAGIVTCRDSAFFMHKGSGMVRDVFRTRNMRALPGHMGVAHCRYPTAGSASDAAESQPFYVNSPFGLVLAHNGNLTNTVPLMDKMVHQDLRHINTQSDSEVLLNVLASELQEGSKSEKLSLATIFDAVSNVHRRCKGAYAVVAMIAGYGMLAFRDPYGIRPLIVGVNRTPSGTEYLVASESVALDTLGFSVLRDVAPGEALFIDQNHEPHFHQCAESPLLSPCIFEYVYLARPDSVIDGVSVYEARLKMGEHLADKITQRIPLDDIDVVIPIPDSARPAAMQLATRLSLPYREGFVKNRYIGRTFIMPGQAIRKKSVRQKLNTVSQEFKGKRVLLVDDSIVRGTTSREIIDMARASGARAVYFASAAPPVRYPNVYGIDMPTRGELIASGRSENEIAREIGADALVFQDIAALKASIQAINPAISRFDCSCFDGQYITGDVTKDYLDAIERHRNADDLALCGDSRQLTLNLADETMA